MLSVEKGIQLPEEHQLHLKKKTLPDLLEEIALEHPLKLSVVSGYKRLTFKELNNSIHDLASFLIEKKVKPGTTIAVYADRSIELIIAFFAILKAGGVYVPLDTLNPKDLQTQILSETTPLLLLAGDIQVPGYIQELVEAHSIHSILSQAEVESAPMIEQKISPQDLAYIVYTSAHDGKQAGAALKHQGMVNIVYWYRTKHSFGPGDVSALVARPGYDASIGEICSYLCNGVTVHIPPEPVLLDPDLCIEWIREKSLSLIYIPTSLAEIMIQHAWPLNSSLRYLFTGGEQLKSKPSPHLPFTVVNSYGPAENTYVSMEYVIPKEERSTLIPIGEPIANIKMVILDESMREVQSGEAGELCFGGIGLAKEYIHQNKLNQQKFIIHTQLGKRPERLLLTGDLVRERTDGKVEFLGRVKENPCIDPSGLYKGEIESVINTHPNILQAVIRILDHPKRMVCYLVEKEKNQTSILELETYLCEKLPKDALPDHFIKLASFPLQRNGKVNYNQLPLPVENNEKNESPAPATNPVERQLILFWEEAFGIRPIGTNQSFFDLGGNYQIAKKLISQMKKQFGKKFPISLFFTNQTIEEIVPLIVSPRPIDPPEPVVQIKQGEGESPIFCIHNVEGHIYDYRALKKHLTASIPVYGIQIEGVESKESIEKMAEQYVTHILAVQPKGPYNILGTSMGGLIAYEIAKQLSQQGYTLGLIGVIETNPPNISIEGKATRLWQQKAHNFFLLSSEEKKKKILQSFEKWEQKTSRYFGLSTEKSDQEEKASELAEEKTFHQLKKIVSHYQPNPTPLAITLIVSEEMADHEQNNPKSILIKWRQITNKVHIKRIPCSAGEILIEENVKYLVKFIEENRSS